MSFVKYSAIAGFLAFSAAVVAFLAQMWQHPWDAAFFAKMLHTDGVLLAAAFVSGFLARESAGAKASSGRWDVVRVTAVVCFVLFVVGAITYLAQLWGKPWSGAMYDKIILTEGALFVIVFGMNFLVRESRLSDSINNGDKLE